MGTGVTQIANSGISISFDCRGRELLRTGKAERGFYILPLDLARRATFYRRAGDFVPLLCLLFLAGCAVQAVRSAKNPVSYTHLLSFDLLVIIFNGELDNPAKI